MTEARPYSPEEVIEHQRHWAQQHLCRNDCQVCWDRADEPTKAALRYITAEWNGMSGEISYELIADMVSRGVGLPDPNHRTVGRGLW